MREWLSNNYSVDANKETINKQLQTNQSILHSGWSYQTHEQQSANHTVSLPPPIAISP
jgi:hypothetical protein